MFAAPTHVTVERRMIVSVPVPFVQEVLAGDPDGASIRDVEAIRYGSWLTWRGPVALGGGLGDRAMALAGLTPAEAGRGVERRLALMRGRLLEAYGKRGGTFIPQGWGHGSDTATEEFFDTQDAGRE